MKQIIIATSNQGKAAEFKQFFLNYQIEAVSLLDLPETLPDIEETGATFKENAALKAEQIAALVNQPVLADDSGLVIDALDGEPGIYSARYAGKQKSDLDNMAKVLEKLKNIPLANRTARFISVLAIARPGEETIFKTGTCEGHIALEAAGEHGFGYDPIFIPVGFNQTMAEISAEEKSQISHRADAMLQLDAWIKQFD